MLYFSWHSSLNSCLTFALCAASSFLILVSGQGCKWMKISLGFQNYLTLGSLLSGCQIKTPNIRLRFLLQNMYTSQFHVINFFCFDINITFPIAGSLSGWPTSSVAKREPTSGNNLCCQVNFLKLLLISFEVPINFLLNPLVSVIMREPPIPMWCAFLKGMVLLIIICKHTMTIREKERYWNWWRILIF